MVLCAQATKLELLERLQSHLQYEVMSTVHTAARIAFPAASCVHCLYINAHYDVLLESDLCNALQMFGGPVLVLVLVVQPLQDVSLLP